MQKSNQTQILTVIYPKAELILPVHEHVNFKAFKDMKISSTQLTCDKMQKAMKKGSTEHKSCVELNLEFSNICVRFN